MNISILGNNLISATMAAVFASVGNTVEWCRLSQRSLDNHLVNDQQLELLLKQQIVEQRLLETDLLNLNINKANIIILGLEPQQFEEAKNLCKELQQLLSGEQQPTIINTSTFGVGKTEELQQYLAANWVYIPDNIQEGRSIESLLNIKSLVVGYAESQSRELIRVLFRPFFRLEKQFLFMPIRDAEFTKLTISGMLATRISYMNDMAHIAESLDIDIENVRQGMGADTRIGASYLFPGCGFGGSNFSQDILMLSDMANVSGSHSQLLKQVWDINKHQKEILFRKLWHYYQCQLKNKTVGIWGVAFKPYSDSIINATIHELLVALWSQQVKVKVYDPQALKQLQEFYGARADLEICDDPYQAVENVDALMLLTEWPIFASPDFVRIKALMQQPLLLDGRNLYSPQYVKSLGFAYFGVGRS